MRAAVLLESLNKIEGDLRALSLRALSVGRNEQHAQVYYNLLDVGCQTPLSHVLSNIQRNEQQEQERHNLLDISRESDSSDD